MFIALRDAKCSRPRRNRAGHEVFSQRQTTSSSSRRSSLPQADTSSASPTASSRPAAGEIGPRRGDDVAGLLDDDGVAFAECPCARCPRRCAAWPSRSSIPRRTPARARRTASRAGASDVDVDPQQLRVRLLRGNLKAVAQRGNFAVVPRRSRSARSSTLTTTPSVSNSSSRRLSAHSRQNASSSSMPWHGASAARPAAPLRAGSPASSSADAASARRRHGDDELIHERAQAALRHQRRIEIAHRPGRGVARDWRTAARRRRSRSRLMRSNARAAGTPRRGLRAPAGAAAHGAAGSARMVRTFAVTSSPRCRRRGWRRAPARRPRR